MSHNHSRGRGRARVYNRSIGSWSRIKSILCETIELKRTPLLHSISQDTTDFIRACEALQTRLIDSGILTKEEKSLIEFSALDLLRHMNPQ
jgi:hypothetical protein